MVRSSDVKSRCLRSFTSATLPSSPIMFRSNSGLSGNSFEHKDKEDQVKMLNVTIHVFDHLKKKTWNKQSSCKIYLKTSLKVCHSLPIEKAEAVDWSLISYIPHGRPGNLQHVIVHVTLQSVTDELQHSLTRHTLRND